MRELYATTVNLVHIGGGSAFEVARERTIEWCWRVDSPHPDFTARPIGQEPAEPGDNEIAVSWWSAQASQARGLEMTLRHPDSDDETLQWRAVTSLSEVGGATRVTVRLQRGASVHVVRPGRISLRAPVLVKHLMESPLLAYAGSLELQPGVRRLQDLEVQAFVQDVLRAEGRALPVVVAASEVRHGFLEAMAKAATGLVQVVHSADRRTDELLGAAIGAQSIPDAGMRLYWPGFGLADQVERNPYWTVAQIRAGGRAGPSVINQLVNRVAQVSTDRVPPDPGLLKARREWARELADRERERERANREKARQQRRKAQEAMRAARQESGAGAELENALNRIAELEGDFAASEEEVEQAASRAQEIAERELTVVEEALESENDAKKLRDQLAQLKAENRNMRENLRAVHSYEGTGEESGEEQLPSVPATVSDWDEIARYLPDLEGPGFQITDRAIDCADGKGRYPNPDGMWMALCALERVGREYNERGGQIGQRFEDFAVQVAGLEISLQDNTYKNHLFQFEGDEYSRLPHVKADDAKSPNAVGRIYFALDGENSRLIIDWFGTKPDRP